MKKTRYLARRIIAAKAGKEKIMAHVAEVERNGKIYRVKFFSGAGNREGIRRTAKSAIMIEFRGESVKILTIDGNAW